MSYTSFVRNENAAVKGLGNNALAAAHIDVVKAKSHPILKGSIEK